MRTGDLVEIELRDVERAELLKLPGRVIAMSPGGTRALVRVAKRSKAARGFRVITTWVRVPSGLRWAGRREKGSDHDDDRDDEPAQQSA